MHRKIGLLGLVLVAAVFASCSSDETAGAPPPAGGEGNDGTPCLADADCAGDEICIDALCAPRDGISCADDSHCELGQHCDAGSCAPGVRCTSNDDCPVSESCQAGACQPDFRTPCDADGDCDAGQTCEERFCDDSGAGGGGGAGPVDCLTYAPEAPVTVDGLGREGEISFGSAPNVGEVRLATVVITNTCDREVRVLQADFETSTSDEFAVSPNLALPAPLARGGQLTLEVTYAPHDFLEDREGQVLVVTSTDTKPTAKYRLAVEYKGSSVFSLTEDPGETDPLVGAILFGATPVGSVSTKTLYLRNAGNGNHLLHVSSINVDAAGTVFSVEPSLGAADEPIVLPPFHGCLADTDCAAGHTCDAPVNACRDEAGELVGILPITVTFAPTQARPESQKIIIEHDEGGSGAAPVVLRHEIALTGGGGNAPTITVNPEAIDFGQIEIDGFGERTITITNAGDQPLTVTSLGFAALSSADFSFTPAVLPAIPGGGFQNVVVRFSPTGVIGVRAGALQLASDDPARPSVSVALQGTATDPNTFVNPMILTIPGVWRGDPANTNTVSVRNSGFGDLVVTAVRIGAGSDPGFALRAPPLNAVTLPDSAAELLLTVEFNPTRVGAALGALEIETNDVDNPLVTVALSSEGLDCGCTIPGANFTCDHGTCVFAGCLPGLIDNNQNLADGCEYACTPTGVADYPDPTHADDDCDGYDGTLTRAWFVATNGNDAAGLGTPASPLATISAALALATPGVRDHIYVSDGTYTEHLQLRDGVSIWGGFSRANGWTRSAANQSRVTWSTVGTVAARTLIAVRGANLTAQTVLADLTIDTPDTASTETTNYALYCTACVGLVLERNVITAGAGGPGVAGGAGGTGAAGSVGGTGGGGDVDGGAWGGGGPGGTSSCGAVGGPGGRGGTEGNNAGIGGSPGSGGAAGGGGGSGSNRTVCWSGCCGDDSGNRGVDGTGGGTGSAGNNGSGGTPAGALSGNFWIGVAGAAGLTGGTGGSGGGGGGGGGQGGDVLCVNEGSGNGGGGGGGAGCGGSGGLGGSAGGGSFGVFLVNSTGVIVSGNTITSRSGGRGGASGSGGDGGGGAGGGSGGTAGLAEVGGGGNGGAGGSGGRGGHGGGGAGGVSYAVYRSNTSVNVGGNNLAFGAGGQGGTSLGTAGQQGAAASNN